MAAGNGLCPNRSKELLRTESGPGFGQSLVVDPARSRRSTPPQIVRVERSSLVDRVQSFLPKMANANQELLKQMEISKPGQFDIENIDDCSDNIIEMNVSLFEMNGCDESGEETLTSEDEDSQCENDSQCGEVTEANLKLHRSQKQKKCRIEVLPSDGTH
ncbi:uncharacterized protein C12orf45 homolog [Hemiscyllium ocellatum]|uniref:uncharacterized protein C12orf45 homolog n=1 Tax=Hemiscyllium ocellatum TaxID=170820 RepID=UPI0029675EC1|nr:uncharacterized protein C12orf45 homolog [Hemiscyllium ocellatum]